MNMFIKKFLENILSIKVWVIFAYIILSFYLVLDSKMTGQMFATSTGSIISIVLAIREGIKVRKISAASNGTTQEQIKEIDKISV